MRVFKFGGTSIAHAKRMQGLLDIIPLNEKIIVVLSAISGVTNLLQSFIEKKTKKSKQSDAILNKLKQLHQSFSEQLLNGKEEKKQHLVFIQKHLDEIDQYDEQKYNFKDYHNLVITKGELFSTNLFYWYLKEKNIPSSLLDVLEIIKVQYGKPSIPSIQKAILPLIEKKQIYIIPGFICMNENNKVDHLGRGSSDYTATLIGAAVAAQEVQIWTDVNGMLQTDPRLIPMAKSIKNLSYNQASELAYFGAKVLHPRCIFPVMQDKIPILLKNTLFPKAEGTLISEELSTERTIKALAVKDQITCIKIHSNDMVMTYGYVAKLFKIFQVYKTPIDMIATSETSVSLTIDKTKNLEAITHALNDIGQVEISYDNSIIAIIGYFSSQQSGIAFKVLKAVQKIPIQMVSYGGSQNNFSFLIQTSRKKEVIESLYDQLF